MPYKILIVDLHGKSGKTTLSLGLIYALKNIGFKICPFKPLSIHDWFTDYSTTLENIKYGTIFCNDIIKLREVSQCRQRYEFLNPIDMLTTPLDPSWFIENNFSSMYYTYNRDILKKTVIARTSIIHKNNIYNIGIVNQWLLEKSVANIEKEIVQKLSLNNDQIIEIFNTNSFEKVFNEYLYKAIKNSYIYLNNAEYDILLIESLKDLAWPLTNGVNVDIVLGLSPGTVLVYDAKRYKLALSLKGTHYSIVYGLRTRDIFEYLTPLKIFRIPPLPTIFVPEMIKEKIENIAEYINKNISSVI